MKKNLAELPAAAISGEDSEETEETFRLRQAQCSDLPALALLLEECFGMDIESAEYRLSEFLQSKEEREGGLADAGVGNEETAVQEELHPVLKRCTDPESKEAAGEGIPSRQVESVILQEGCEGYYVWKALLSGNTAGMCAFCTEGNCASLFDICVAKAFRRRGIGTKMLNGVLAGLKAAGIKSVILQVSSSDKEAVRLYRRLGFVQTDRLDYYCCGSFIR